MLEYEGNVEEDMMITFQVQYEDMFGGTLTHNLKENAENIPVTKENRQVCCAWYLSVVVMTRWKRIQELYYQSPKNFFMTFFVQKDIFLL